MSAAYNIKPFWIKNAVKQKANREAVGARLQDVIEFKSALRVSLRKPIDIGDDEEMRRHVRGKNVIDIDEKEFANTGSQPDTFTIKTQKTSVKETKKSYELKTSKGSTLSGGGGVDISTNFFNVNGPGASLSGKASREKTKEVTRGHENTRGLSQEYGVLGEITVPPMKSVEVRLTTYAVSYGIEIELTASMPTSSLLKVLAPQKGPFGCCCNRYVGITAEEFLRIYSGENKNKIYTNREGSIAYLDFIGCLQYTGEEVQIDKKIEKPIGAPPPITTTAPAQTVIRGISYPPSPPPPPTLDVNEIEVIIEPSVI